MQPQSLTRVGPARARRDHNCPKSPSCTVRRELALTRVPCRAAVVAVFAATLAGASAVAAPPSGSLQSDGCAAARVAYSGPEGAIWVAAADRGAAHRVSTISGLSPTWSPDGNQIAFRHIDGKVNPGVADLPTLEVDAALLGKGSVYDPALPAPGLPQHRSR